MINILITSFSIFSYSIKYIIYYTLTSFEYHICVPGSAKNGNLCSRFGIFCSVYAIMPEPYNHLNKIITTGRAGGLHRPP